MGDGQRELDGRETLEAVFAVARDRRISAEELRLWLIYRSYERREHGGYPGDELLGEHMDRSPRSVQGYRASLLEKGFLDQTLRGPKPAHYRAVLPDNAPEIERPEKEAEEADGEDALPTPAEAVERGYPDAFEACWAIYPSRDGGNPKKAAYRAWRARVRNGADPEELQDGTERYRAFCERTDKLGSRFVMQARTFFGPDEHWREDYDASGGDTPEPSVTRDQLSPAYGGGS